MISASVNTMVPKIQAVLSRKPVTRAWIFGSYSRGEETPQSDVDILVQYDNGCRMSLMDSAALAVGPTGSFTFGSQGVDTKKFNLGIGSALVFTFAKHLSLNAGYEYGFLNRYNSPASGSSLKTAKLNFGISYLF